MPVNSSCSERSPTALRTLSSCEAVRSQFAAFSRHWLGPGAHGHGHGQGQGSVWEKGLGRDPAWIAK